MPRKATGKPLTLFPIRVDEDVKAALLGFKASGTINEGLRKMLFALGFFSADVKYLGTTPNGVQYTPEIEKRIAAQVKPQPSEKEK